MAFADQPQPSTVHATARMPHGVRDTSVGMRLLSYLLDVVLVTVTFGIGWLVWALLTASNGQTPGKKLLGQRVIYTATGVPAGIARMFFLRGLVAGLVAAFVIPLTIGLLLLMPLFDTRNRNLWDRLSGCHVVDDPHNAWHR